jgi:hypothetical protein
VFNNEPATNALAYHKMGNMSKNILWHRPLVKNFTHLLLSLSQFLENKKTLKINHILIVQFEVSAEPFQTLQNKLLF